MRRPRPANLPTVLWLTGLGLGSIVARSGNRFIAPPVEPGPTPNGLGPPARTASLRHEATATMDESAPESHGDRLRPIIESALDAFVVVDADGFILEWNRKAEQLFGWKSDEVHGQQLTLVPSFSGQAGEQSFTALGRHDQPVAQRMVMPVVDRSGRAVPVELTLWSTRHDGTLTYNAFFRELTPQVQSVDDLMCPGGSIVQSSEAVILSEDLDGRILTWNHAAEHLYGYSAAEALGQPSSLIVPPDQWEETARLHESVRRGEQVANHETVRLRKDGTPVEVSLTISPVHDPVGRVVGISTIGRDITEVRRMAMALEAALEEARESEARSRRFLADAAHQLRTPVASILACADTLLQISSVAGRERLLGHLTAEAERAGRMVNGLLRMARLDQGHTPTPLPCDLVRLCQDEAERSRLQAPDLDIFVDARALVGGEWLIDADMLREILSNLLDNARRHARSRIDVAVSQTALGLEIRVGDDGPGVPAEKVDVVFERFRSQDGKGGSGLGLPIAKGLAQAHGGDVSYEDGAFVVRVQAEVWRIPNSRSS